MHIAVSVLIILAVAAGGGLAFFFAAKAAIAHFERMQIERRGKAFQRELAARQARMTRFSMTQFAGTKASERNW